MGAALKHYLLLALFIFGLYAYFGGAYYLGLAMFGDLGGAMAAAGAGWALLYGVARDSKQRACARRQR